MLPMPFNNPRTYAGHSGVDFAQPRGTQFRASGPGRIVKRTSNARAGKVLWVRYDSYPHDIGYAHLDNYTDSAAPGSRISEGQVIGRVGNTGNSTGPHLHVENSGAASTAGFYQAFDKNRVVGAAPAAAFSQEVANQQAWLNASRGEKLAVDGIRGPATIAAFKRYQSFLGVTVDGVWGPGTQAAHQRYYDSQQRPQIAVDGSWGAGTTKALQRALGVGQDGVLGPQTYKALQARVGATADGVWGPNSKRALQRHLGVAQDGVVGPATVRALQQRLNAGTF